MISVVLQSLFALGFVLACVSFVVRAYMKFMFSMRDKRMDRSLVQPTGSSVCHGMTFSTEGRGVVREQQPSYAWYKRVYKSL